MEIAEKNKAESIYMGFHVGMIKTANETLKPMRDFLLSLNILLLQFSMGMLFAWCSYNSPNAYFPQNEKVVITENKNSTLPRSL